MSDKMEHEDEGKICEKIESALMQEDANYYTFIKGLQELKKLGKLDKLRNARERFSLLYPLQPKVWLEWLEDEEKLAKTVEDKEPLKYLYERAILDYNHPDIWLGWIKHLISMCETGLSSLEEVKLIYDRALYNCAYFPSDQILKLFDTYLLFEKQNLAKEVEANSNAGDNKSILVVKNRIKNLFLQQLSSPFVDSELVCEEFRKWMDADGGGIDHSDIDTNAIVNDRRRTNKPLLEHMLMTSDVTSWPRTLRTFISNEEKESKATVEEMVALFEFATSILIGHDIIDTRLWKQYARYVAKNMPELTLLVCERGVRNCNDESDLYILYMFFIEKRGEGKVAMSNILSRAMEPINCMKAGDMLSLWMWYLTYLTRQLKNVDKSDEPTWNKSLDDIRETSSRAVTYFTTRYSTYDPDCQLLLWCARFEAELGKNMERCRQIWTEILNSGFDKNPSYWLMYLNTEWQFGDSKHMRRLGVRAMHSQVTLEGLNLICALIQQYESINGSVDSMMNILTAYDEHASKIAKRDRSEKKKFESEKKLKDEKMLPKRVAVKRPAEVKEGPSQSDDFIFKKPLSDVKKIIKPTQDRVEAKRTGQDNRTAFVSNLAYDVTEEELRETFSKAGDIEEIRVMKDFKGRGKGYSYITFKNQEGLAAAMAMDRIPINKRPAFVSKCEPDKETRKTGLRYKTGLEKNKLFVKGLPLTMEKSALEDIFGKFGKLKEARIVTFRNGHSKGIAFVEYEDETSAHEALEKTDGMEMAEGKKISVSISNPPDKKEPKSVFGPTTVADKFNADKCLGGGATQSGGSRGKGRTQIAFVPASVQKLSSNVPKANATEKMDLS